MIRKACAIRSEDRYQSAKAFYEDLAVWGTPLAKKLQEDIPQKQQQEKTSQIISQKHSSLSERKSQNKNPPPDQTAHLLFTDNAQEEYTDTSRDIDRNTRTEQTTGLNMPGIGDSHIPGAKDDDKADSKQQRSGRSRIINYAIVFALVGVLIWLGYSLIGGIKQTAHSSSSSSSIASTDEAAESAILASTYEEGDAVITLSTAEFAVLAAASTAEYAETASFDTTYEEAEGDISDTQEEIATSEAIKDTISDSWDEIIAAGEDGSYIEKYHIGDTKELDLGEEGVIRMELVALDTDELADGSGKAHMTWIAKNVLTSYHCMNEYYNEGSGERGWPDSDMRTWLRENIFPLIPDNVELNIKEVTKYSYSFCDGGTISSHDLIWIPSVREVSEKEDFFGGKQCYEDYGPQYISAFSDDESRQKYLIGTSYPAWWWLRSAGSDYRFDLFHSDDYDDYCNDDGEGGVVIGFCL